MAANERTLIIMNLPCTAWITFRLVLAFKGDYKEAESLFQRSLAIDEEAFGPDHPEVAVDLKNMGSLLETLVRGLRNFSRISIELTTTGVVGNIVLTARVVVGEPSESSLTVCAQRHALEEALWCLFGPFIDQTCLRARTSRSRADTPKQNVSMSARWPFESACWVATTQT